MCFRDDDHDDDGSDEAASNDEGDYDAAELVTRATRCLTAATTVVDTCKERRRTRETSFPCDDDDEGDAGDDESAPA